MKAAVLKSNQIIEIENLPLGDLEEDSCRVKIAYCGICSSDIQRGFSNGAYFYPLVMGHEMVGEITQTGCAVKGFDKGDRVAIFPLLPCFECEPCKNELYAQCQDYGYYGSRRHGGYAEFLDVKEWNLIKLSSKIRLKDAVALEPMAVTLHSLNQGSVLQNPPKNIAIIGAGIMGLLACQIIKEKCPDTNITLIDRNKFKLDIIKGISTALLKTEDDWAKFIENSTFEVVLEATGAPISFERSINIASAGAKVIWMGNITDDLTIMKKNVSSILRKELQIIGCWNSLYRPDKSDDWKDALKLMEEGIHPSEIISHWISLEEVSETIRKMHNHKSGKESFPVIKAVIDLSGGVE